MIVQWMNIMGFVLFALSFSESLFSPQTLFKLHLRTKQQANQSTIYGKWFSIEEINKLITDFGKRAKHALFFIPIKRIKASYPSKHKQHQESWVVERSTEYYPGFSGVMDICSHQSSFQPKLEKWSVLFKTIPLQAIPHEFHPCLSVHKIQVISIGIAGALDSPPHSQPPHSHQLFFGLPLLDTISLPIHLHCTFILSGDKRSIWFDQKRKGNVESRFNKWLLTEQVPPFYFQFLAGWDHPCPMEKCPWWPKKIGTDTISNVVVMGMNTILPTSDQLVCDTYAGHRIAPSQAHFLQDPRSDEEVKFAKVEGNYDHQKTPLPYLTGDLLQKLLPNDLAIIPPGFSSSPLQNVNNDYLTTILQQKAAFIISMYKEGKITVNHVVSVARFLKLSFSDSLGLPLLPLADGTLASLSAQHTTFYCPLRQHETPWLPFPPHHFLDPKATKDNDIYDLLYVRKLDIMAISRLIPQITERNTFSSPTQELWFDELWDFLNATPEIKIKHPTFERLPLIPTYNPETPTRISFQELTGSDVLFVRRHEDSVPLRACVTLGMKVIKASDCKKTLKQVIGSHKEWPSEIHRAVIEFFMDLPQGQIPHLFQRLSHELHSEFSQWFRQMLSGSYRVLTDPEKTTVQHLPLWETVQAGLRSTRFISANEAIVIPQGISPEVVGMWAGGTTEFIPADYILSLMKEPITPPAFYVNHLSFPPVMDCPTPVYKSLLEAVLRSSDRKPWILVPNASGRMLPSTELYLSSNPTFINAFASRDEAFLHPDLRSLERRLCDWGLIDDITTDSFGACAEAIRRDITREDIYTRAPAVFHAYNTQMPRKLLGDHDSQRALQNLRFIPRRLGSTRYGSIPTDRYHALPNIVSPSEILDPDFVRVAWTQRAVCHAEPSRELRLVNSSTWKPEASEVVCFLLFVPLLTSHSPFQIQHLRVLSTEIAPDLGYNSELIEDLKATYSWLAEHESEAEGLLDYNQERLFLNVDDPIREWRWNSASELLFDENDSSNPRRVREFLKNHGGLLHAAGVRTIDPVLVPDHLLREVSHETRLTQISNSFNEMREADQLTDVTFIAEDDTEFTAHRVFLATQVVHFKASLTRGWSGEKVRIPHSQECLKAVLGT